METREKNTKERILEEALKLFSQSRLYGNFHERYRSRIRRYKSRVVISITKSNAGDIRKS